MIARAGVAIALCGGGRAHRERVRDHVHDPDVGRVARDRRWSRGSRRSTSPPAATVAGVTVLVMRRSAVWATSKSAASSLLDGIRSTGCRAGSEGSEAMLATLRTVRPASDGSTRTSICQSSMAAPLASSPSRQVISGALRAAGAERVAHEREARRQRVAHDDVRRVAGPMVGDLDAEAGDTPGPGGRVQRDLGQLEVDGGDRHEGDGVPGQLGLRVDGVGDGLDAVEDRLAPAVRGERRLDGDGGGLPRVKRLRARSG